MTNFFPAILYYKDYQFNSLTELNAEIAQLEQQEPDSVILRELKAQRTDILFVAENLSTAEIYKNILTAWGNYQIAERYGSTWMTTFSREIGCFVFLLHLKLTQNPNQ